MAISKNHTSVKACFSCPSGRNNFNFGRQKVFFFDIIHIFQNLKNIFLNRFFFFFFLVLIHNRHISDYNVKCFALNHLCSFFLQLFSGKMNQKIGYEKYRVLFILTNIHFDGCAIFFYNDAMKCQRQSYPLVFFHAAIIVCIQISNTAIFVQWILFHIQSWRVDVCT